MRALPLWLVTMRKRSPSFLAPVMLDFVFVPSFTRRDHARRALWRVAGHEPHFGGRLRRGREQDETAAARALDADEEPFVVLAVDAHIGARIGAERVAPHLMRAHRFIGTNVEARLRVVGPGQPVPDIFDDVGEFGTRLEIAEAQGVTLATRVIGCVREDALPGCEFEAAEREVVAAARQLVLVEDQHRVGRSRAPRTPVMARVLQAFDGSAGVLPRSVGDRCRLVGFLNAPADLFEELVA